MGRYENWLKRKQNATEYASQANCRKCTFSENVRGHIFCNGQGKSKRIPWSAWDTDKIGYCPEYIPFDVLSKQEKDNDSKFV